MPVYLVLDPGGCQDSPAPIRVLMARQQSCSEGVGRREEEGEESRRRNRLKAGSQIGEGGGGRQGRGYYLPFQGCSRKAVDGTMKLLILTLHREMERC